MPNSKLCRMILRKKKSRNQKPLFNKSKSFATISTISLIGAGALGIAASLMIAFSFPKIARSYNAPKDEPTHNIKLAIDHPKPLALIDEKPGILPGESTLQREAREKAEALARLQSRAVANGAAARKVVTRERRVYNDPASFDAVYAAAEAAFGVDARILRAIHYVETGASGSTYKTNASGATGPMQFLPSTFARHAIDGNNDGIKDVHNLEDSVFTAAAYLRACGWPNIKSAIMGYNRSISYYNKVMKVAASLGFQQ